VVARGDPEPEAFKISTAAEREQALALEGTELFHPGGRGRPFKEWVAVPAAQANRWPELSEQALC
jgi:hypothetical protein